jgi:hypothetical protein
MVICGVSLDPEQKAEFTKILSDEFGVTEGNFLNEDKQPWSVPSLFQWTTYHTALTERFPGDNLDDKLARAPKEWMPLLGKRDILFFVFLREWILNIRSVVGDHLQQVFYPRNTPENLANSMD